MRKIIINVSVSIVLVLSAFSPVLADLSVEPVSRLSNSNRDLYQTDLFTGSATYSYPIKVPKGTSDLTPDVSLSYYSGGVHDSSAYTGMGWALNQDYIERDTNFTAASTGDDKYRLHFKGATYDLVYVSGESRYHTKIESNLYIQKLTGGSNDYDDYWQVKTTDGTVYRFGNGTNSEQICNGLSYVYRWNLDLVTDVHSNHIYYTYSESNGASYLSKIEYNTEKARVVDFTYSSNPYSHQVYVQGCSIQEGSQLSNIQVKANTNLVHQFDLSYATATNSGQLLQSITEKGSDGSSTLPSTSFSYKPVTKTWNASHETWINNGNTDYSGTEKPDISIQDVNTDGLPDIVRGKNDYQVLLNHGSNWSSSFDTLTTLTTDTELSRTDIRLLDVNGDKVPDIVKSTAGSGSTKSTWDVWAGINGGTWNTSAVRWVNDDFIDALISWDYVALADVNADGLPDILRTHNQTGTPPTWKVYKNTGSTWSTSYESWQGPTNIDLSLPYIRLADVNGDSLPDIVKTTYSGSNATWTVYKNTGSGWSTSAETWINNANIDAHLEQDTVELSDVNGDGLMDIVKGYNASGLNSWKVLLNRGNSWDTSWDAWMNNASNDANVTVGRVRLLDANGDGLPDLVRSDESGGHDTYKVWINSGNAPDLLSKVTTSQGGTISFDYKASTIYDNTGADSISDLPFSVWVVDKMTVKNGMTNAHATDDQTTYSYKDGLYDAGDREFRGFAEVNTVEPDGSKKKYVFNQDDSTKGKLAEVQHRDSSNNPYDENENTWSTSTSNGVTTVKLDTEKEYSFDGTASNPKIKQTDYQYDTYGNITKLSDKGDASTSADDRFIYNEYTVNTSDWIVNTPKHTYKNASNDSTKVAESWFYYDGNSGLSDSPTKGDLTKKVDWLSGGSNPETTYTYDSYGNKLTETDTNNHTTTYTYNISDSTRTYAERVTNAKSQQTNYSYDLGTGNLLTQTDPNSLTISYTYDVFGRITKEIKPYDNSTYPSVSYTYSFDGAAPENVLVSKREVSSSSASLNTYTFLDGLERKIQTRTEAQDTSKQIVVDTFYDPNGEVKKETLPYLATLGSSYGTPDVAAKYTEIDYDAIGRATLITNPKGDNKTIAYDHWKRTTTDENGSIKREFFNAFGKIITVDEVLNGATIDTEYTYDSNDNLTKITDAPGNEITFTFDTLGRKTSQVDPDMGTWTYSYDGVGNITSQTDARSITTTRQYDELNRVTKVDYPTNSDTSFIYDGNGKIGTVTIATDSAGTINFFYDNRLRKTQEQRIINGTTKTTQLSYDALDRVATTTNPDGEVITNTFNSQGEIASVSGVLTNIDYNALGKITQKTYANGLSTSYSYNTSTDQRLNRIQTSSLQDLNYTYDNGGNIKSVTDSILSKSQNYSYDDLGRLKTASDSAGLSSDSYHYNSIGNITKVIQNGVETNYSYGQGAGVHAMTSATESAGLKTDSIKDDWSSGSINSVKWNDWGGAQTTVTLGQLTINSTLGSGYYGVETNSSTSRDFTGSSVTNKLINAGNQALTSWSVFPVVIDKTGGNNSLFWAVESNKIRAYKNVSGTTTMVQELTYNSSNHKFFRIRENSGTVYWDYSTNGTTWTTLTSVATPFDVTSVIVGVSVGTWQTEGSTTTAVFDNLNSSIVTPSTSTFSDDWSSGSINDSKWENWGHPQTSVVSNQLRITSTSGSGYYGVNSETSGDLNLTGSFVSDQVIDAGNQSLTSWGVFPVQIDKVGGSNSLFWAIESNKIRAYKTVSGTTTMMQETTYNSSTHKYFKIRESNGTIYWDYSTNGTSWTNFTSIAVPFDITKVVIGANGGTWQTEASTTTATLDNFTVWSPSTSTMKDSWSSGYIDPAKWSNWGGAQITVSNQQLSMTSTTTSGYYGVENSASSQRFDLTNSYLTNQLVDAGNQSITSWEVYPLYTFSAVDSSMAYYWLVSGNSIKAYKKVSGSSTQLSSTTYNSSNHKYFRIRESGGTIYFDTSANGNTWTNFTSTANAFTSDAMIGEAMIGTWQNEGSTTTAKFDNFNVVPMIFTYDANGNMTSDGTTCYQYNEANQLDKATNCSNSQTIAEYVYDFNGMRMVKKNFTNGTQVNTVTSWSDSFETKEIVGGSTTNTSYYFVNAQLIAKKDNSGTKTYFHNDHLGSTSLVTTQSGAVLEATTYDPWGELLSGGTTSKFLYTGQEKDSETGLHYYNARYYNSDIRRFIQPDQYIQDVYNPQTLNRYSYVLNNPLRYTDPTGNFSFKGFVSSLKNAVSSFVSNILSPKPSTSTAKLPNNIPTTSVNLQNKNGSVQTAYTNEKIQPTFLGQWGNDVINKGNVDIGVSGSAGPVTFGGGVKFNRQGTTQYVNAGGGREIIKGPNIKGVGIGGSLLFSTKPVEQRSGSASVSWSTIVAMQFKVDGRQPYNITKWEFEAVGIGCCGVDITGEYTGSTVPYTEPVQAPVYSKPIEEVYK